MMSVLLTDCERSLPEYVYVLEASQSIELEAFAAAATVKQGVPVVLHARRETRGVWRRIPSRDLKPEQCWMGAIPPMEEPEVADNVLWRVKPSSSVKFNIDFRADHTRTATLAEPCVYTFVASTGAWCEPGRQMSAPAFRVIVKGS